MNVTDLDTRVKVKRLTKTSDGFGGTTSTSAEVTSFWASKEHFKGEIQQENGKRQQYFEIKLTAREQTVDTILPTDILTISGETGDYRINDIYDSKKYEYFKIIEATKIG